MIVCSHCGIQNDDARRQCFKCKAELAAPELPPPPLDPQTGAYGPPPLPAEAEAVLAMRERFLRGFALGVCCPFYFLSRATPREAIMVLVWGVTQFIAAGLVLALPDTSHPAILALSYLRITGLIAFVFILAEGSRVRRQRWAGLPWFDFEHFRRAEATWAYAGVIWAIAYCFLSELVTSPSH